MEEHYILALQHVYFNYILKELILNNNDLNENDKVNDVQVIEKTDCERGQNVINM